MTPMLTLQKDAETDVVTGAKTRTTRWNLRHYLKLAGFSEEAVELIFSASKIGLVKCRSKTDGRLHFWLGAPRTKLPWVRKLGFSKKNYMIEAVKGRFFTEQMAREDGFGSVQEFKQRLMELHGKTMNEVEEHTWASFPIEWEEGPN